MGVGFGCNRVVVGRGALPRAGPERGIWGGTPRRWAGWIREQKWEHAWVYFKHDDDTAGPELALDFLRRF